MRFSGWKEDFNCTDGQQLKEISTAIKLYIIVYELRIVVKDLVIRDEGLDCLSTKFQCAYWNSHVLGNCSAYESLGAVSPGGSGDKGEELEAEDLASVQNRILQPIYRRSCRGNDSLCRVP